MPSVNGCYKVLTSNHEWSVAQLQCRKLNEDAHLVAINSRAEQNAVATMLDMTTSQFVAVHVLRYCLNVDF